MSESTDVNINGLELKQKVQELQQALLDRHPSMPNLLRVIHKTIQQYPEQVTLLDEAEIKIIVNGLERQTGVELAVAATKGKTTSVAAKAKLNNLDAF